MKIKTPSLFTVNFEHISHLVLVFLIKGAKQPVSELHDAFQSNTSLAPKKHENFRPIINFKRLNKLIHYHFKIQGLMQRSLPKQKSQDKTGSEGCIFQF